LKEQKISKKILPWSNSKKAKAVRYYSSEKKLEPTKLFFFGVKLVHFTINKCFSVCNKNASSPAKNREILRYRRNKVWYDPIRVNVV